MSTCGFLAFCVILKIRIGNGTNLPAVVENVCLLGILLGKKVGNYLSWKKKFSLFLVTFILLKMCFPLKRISFWNQGLKILDLL